MSGLDDLEQIWRLIETSGRGFEREDAEHWIRVYRELVWAAESLLADLGGDEQSAAVGSRLNRRLAALRARLGYWERELDQRFGREPR